MYVHLYIYVPLQSLPIRLIAQTHTTPMQSKKGFLHIPVHVGYILQLTSWFLSDCCFVFHKIHMHVASCEKVKLEYFQLVCEKTWLLHCV